MAFCTPFGYRVARRVPAPAPFFPSMQADFGPFLGMFDELDNLSSAVASQQQQLQRAHRHRQSLRSWQPRFDVREQQDAFHLQGELPGVSQNDLNIEFVDPTTLVVRGKSVREYQAGTPPTASGALPASEEIADSVEQDGTQTATAAPEISRPVSPASSASGHSNYQRPSVEEERDEDWTEAVPTPATTATELAKPAEEQAAQEAPVEQQVSEPKQQEQQEQQQKGHYWVSERSVGTFQRAFNFPSPINQDAVTASLKDGVLSIVVPKEQPKQMRKITIH